MLVVAIVEFCSPSWQVNGPAAGGITAQAPVELVLEDNGPLVVYRRRGKRARLMSLMRWRKTSAQAGSKMVNVRFGRTLQIIDQYGNDGRRFRQAVMLEDLKHRQPKSPD